MKIFCTFILIAICSFAYGSEVILSGWTVMTGGENGGVEYDKYSPEPAGKHTFRGEGTFKVAVTLEEEQISGQRKRFLKLDWHEIIRPRGVNSSWPYRKKPVWNVPVEELSFEVTPVESSRTSVVYDKSSNDNYFKYRAQTRVRGKVWKISISEFKGKLKVRLDSNQSLKGAYWSGRASELREVEISDFEKLQNTPHSLSYKWIAEKDLSHHEKKIISDIVDHYKANKTYDSFAHKRDDLEVSIAKPVKWPYIGAADETLFYQNISSLNEYFDDSTIPGIINLMADPRYIDTFELVQNIMGDVIAVVVDMVYEVEGWDDGGCYFSVLKTINPEAQSSEDYVHLGRGSCF